MVSIGKQIREKTDAWHVRHTGHVPNPAVRRWVLHCAGLCLPEQVYWCDGSTRERDVLRERAQLNEGFRAGMSVFLDRARVEVDPVDEEVPEPRTSGELRPLFRGCMRGRTMYVIPFEMKGANGSAAVRGVQVTDSPGVAADLEEGEESCEAAWAAVSRKGPTLLCLHAEGRHAMPVGRAWDFPAEGALWAMGPGFDCVAVVKAMRSGGRLS
jgi:phosphoenolpyruvate carboxykinase (GTP)